ncbi:hypothetical protein, partial [Brucella inopinata]|uniref:hypothetical protein n=1 Tax=Brucella inopinata TaxID=1218315 RepID=UPI0019D6C122
VFLHGWDAEQRPFVTSRRLNCGDNPAVDPAMLCILVEVAESRNLQLLFAAAARLLRSVIFPGWCFSTHADDVRLSSVYSLDGSQEPDI